MESGGTEAERTERSFVLAALLHLRSRVCTFKTSQPRAQLLVVMLLSLWHSRLSRQCCGNSKVGLQRRWKVGSDSVAVLSIQLFVFLHSGAHVGLKDHTVGISAPQQPTH